MSTVHNYISFKVAAATALTAGDMVELNSDGYLIATTADSTTFIGVAAETCTADEATAGKYITVKRGVIVPLATTATVAPGNKVVVGTTGSTNKVTAFNSATMTPDQIIGIATTGCTGAGTVDVLLN